MFWKKSPAAVLAVLLGIHILGHIDRYVLLGFSPQVIADLSLSNAQYGFLVGVVWVLSFGVMAVSFGALADRYSRTRVIAVGLLVWSVCTWASGHAQTFGQMAVARFFVASGEAALVPAAAALLSELFSERRRGTALGIFFTGIPLGVGLAFLLAGSFGAEHGWRFTFNVLGGIGIAIAVLLSFLKEDRVQEKNHERGAPFMQQLRATAGVMAANKPLLLIIIGFVLVHVLFASLSFTQLWLVKERGMDGPAIAKHMGLLQLAFGTLGAVVGGLMGDRIGHRLPGGQAALMLILVLVCGVAILAYRFAPPHSLLFNLGMCASAFLPLSLYGAANASVLGMVPAHMRSTIMGFNMLSINLFAVALGNMAVGWALDALGKAQVKDPITHVLVATDLVVLSSALFFAAAAWMVYRRSGAGKAQPLVPRAVLEH